MSQVKDEQHQCSLGSLKLPLSQLLTSDDMTMNQRFQLSNSGPNSTLKMKIALRVLSVPQETQEGRGTGRSDAALRHCPRWARAGTWVGGDRGEEGTCVGSMGYPASCGSSRGDS